MPALWVKCIKLRARDGFFALAAIPTVVRGARAGSPSTLQDVIAVRVLLNKGFKCLIEVGDFARTSTAVDFLAVLIEGDGLAILDFEGGAEFGLDQVCGDCQLVRDVLGTAECTADLFFVELLFQSRCLGIGCIKLGLVGLADFIPHLVDLTGIHQFFLIELGDDLQGILGGGTVRDPVESFQGSLGSLFAFAVGLGFGVQARDGVDGASRVECDLFAIVVHIHRLAVLQNCVALVIQFQFQSDISRHPPIC